MSPRLAFAAFAALCAATSVAVTPADAVDHSRGAATCFGKTATTTEPNGTPGPDVIIGGGTVYGNDGNDLICNATIIQGGDGNDRIQVSDGGAAYGQAGDDEIVALSSSTSSPLGSTLNGGTGNDVIWGSPGADTIYGSSGNDAVRASGGNDTLDLGIGNDAGYGDPGDDYILGSVGDDRIDGGLGRDTADGQAGRNRCLSVEKKSNCKKVKHLRGVDGAFARLAASLADDGIRLNR